MVDFAYEDETWTEADWQRLLQTLIEANLLTWKEITTLTLGHMNPSQVGTSLASSDGFKRRYGKGNTMRVVMQWFYEQVGSCTDCGTRLELQADHSTPRESFDDPLDADFIENMVLRCRRCNVIKRPSHEFGGNTHLTAESALMWLLFSFRPRTLKDFTRMCRLYGMTMADIRMQEGWAMAYWLQHLPTFDYIVDDLSRESILLHWPDGALTRAWEADPRDGAEEVCRAPSDHHVAFVASGPHDGVSGVRVSYFRMAIEDVPFSHYFTDSDQAPQSLAVHYSAPNRRASNPSGPTLSPLPPRQMTLHAIACVPADANVKITYNGKTKDVAQSSKRKIGDFSERVRDKMDFRMQVAQ